MKTILHLIDTTGPGGAETVFINLATRLPADKYRAVVVIRGKGWVYEELQRRGVTPVILDSKGSFNLKYLLALRKLIRAEGIDLIQSHLLGSSVYSAMAGLLTRRPVVATFHGEVDVRPDERFGAFKFGLINAGCRHVVAVTDSLRDDLLARTRLSAEQTRVIYNGIDTDAFARAPSNHLRERFGWQDAFIVGSLGNVRPAKGYDVLLRAAALLKDSAHDFRFVIAGQGSGELYDSLLALRHQLGLDERVIFLGFVDDAPGFLAGVDLVMSSSISEGLPLSAIQAMAAGKPLLATRCGGYEGLIEDGIDGRLVAVNDPQALADGLLTLAADAPLRQQLAQAGRDKAVSQYGIDAMYRAYQSLYDRL